MTSSSRILKMPKIMSDVVLVTNQDQESGAVRNELAMLPNELMSVETILREARARAEYIIGRAQKEAARILGEAQSSLSKLQEEARERGYTDGWKRGVVAGEAEIARSLEAVRQIAQSAHIERTQLVKECELNIAALAIDVAKAVVGEEVTLNPNIVARTVERALEKVGADNPIKIRLNPEDYKLLVPYWEKGSGPGEKPVQWEAVEDEHVARGGCIIDTKCGTIDAQVDTQLWKIGRSFTELT